MNIDTPDLSGILQAALRAAPSALLILLGALLLNALIARAL